MFVKQCKGFDSDKVRLPCIWTNWYVSIKYDGHYMQVHNFNRNVRFFTSSGKEFWEKNLADQFSSLPDNIYECEFLGYSEGKHGGRGDAAFATTLRTEFAKGIYSNYPGLKCVIFDIINNQPFDSRRKALNHIGATYPQDNIKVAAYAPVVNDPEDLLRAFVREGWEGIYLKSIAHVQQAGKRVKTAIKMKAHPTVDLEVIDWEEGEGKYKGMIGSLVCRDAKGVMVKVGSGLDDFQRGLDFDKHWDGVIIEVGYESFNDTYIHPVFKCIRRDKCDLR